MIHCMACGFESQDTANWCEFCKEPFRKKPAPPKAAPPKASLPPNAPLTYKGAGAPPPGMHPLPGPKGKKDPDEARVKALMAALPDLKPSPDEEKIPALPPWFKTFA